MEICSQLMKKRKMIGNNERCKLKNYGVKKEKWVYLVEGNQLRATELWKKKGSGGRNLGKGENLIYMWEFNKADFCKKKS